MRRKAVKARINGLARRRASRRARQRALWLGTAIAGTAATVGGVAVSRRAARRPTIKRRAERALKRVNRVKPLLRTIAH